MTALADAEVEYRDNVNKLNYIKFQIEGEDGHVLIATTRPELLCTCKAVAVHPDDKEKAGLVGKTLIAPLFGKRVKVIADPKVQMDYGTGTVMICTIGDKDDLEWVMKYHFEMEKGIDERGRMTELAGKYAGMPVLEAREAAIQDLKDQGILVKQEDNPQQVSICWRCHTPIEYLQVPQWFLKTTDFKDVILQRAKEINWFPEFMRIRLEDWTNSLEWDWVLSRQRIFATPIPVWECEKCGHAVCATKEMCYCDPTLDAPPVDKCPVCGGKLVGCTDVFDTWMDSSGSSLYNTFWERDPELHKKLFPMSLRPQSHDIIRTWAFYSISSWPPTAPPCTRPSGTSSTPYRSSRTTAPTRSGTTRPHAPSESTTPSGRRTSSAAGSCATRCSTSASSSGGSSRTCPPTCPS